MIMKTPPYALIGSFLAFSEAKNMLQAAEAVGLSQPALTNHLKLFEAYFAQDVFALEGRKKVLTPFGMRLRELLKARFQNLDHDLAELGQQYQSPEHVTLRIAGRSEILNLVAPKLEFAGTLVFVPSDGQKATEGLLERKFDIALSNHLEKASQLHGKLLFADGFSVVLPKAWKLKSSPLDSLMETLADRPYLSYKETDENLDKVLSHFKIKSRPFFKKALADWTHLISMVKEGQGWTICPDRYALPETTVSFSLKDYIHTETKFYYLYRKESLKLPWYKDLLDQLAKVLN